ncbi:cache domain-containing sensor histidine kinase [Candidatus Galacturonibacter soehngenii]|uniref:histidine kinase n=1 Tax=Candidatus Galacturonatibacter soehngenii TaxID=2307010 RepID=A0A7V7UF40_9FIRM|nr:sensor histidine kinase [Candidatus Galacturonibacter soehngenii]KAB1435839.1 HAMP domain-containing protein [Candidatus Galacturonibacter soehngenii]MBA4686581.1 sensor histidine kinase [Candidatus Galacturonibacter soehngenii]
MTRKQGNLLFRFKSIRSTMIFFFTMIIAVALIVFLIISIRYTQENIMENSKYYTMQLIEQVNGDIDSYMDYMENISRLISKNKDVIDYLYDETATKEELDQIKTRVISQFQTISDARDDIYNIAVLSDNGRNVINDGKDQLNPYADIKQSEWYVKARQSNGIAVLSSSHVQNAIKDDYKWVVTLSCGIQNPNTGTIEGVLFVDLNYSAINNLCEGISMGSKGYVFIIDSQGRIVYHPRQTLLYSGLKSEKVEEALNGKQTNFTTVEGENSKLYTVYTSEKTGWTVVGVAYLSELMTGREETQLAYLITALFLIIISGIIAIILSSEISKPLKELANSMKAVQEGHFEHAEIEILEQNEIGMLSNSFNIMTQKIKELMEQIVREQRAKRKSELKALQSQINPHFLYNTLDSIIWMSESGKNQEVVLMTSSLAKLLRQSISNEDEIVSIYSEIGYTKSYLTIQKMRYKNKLEFEIDIKEDILNESIVKLVLQPLVENAIYHGIKYKEDGKGFIRIMGERVENDIVICIEDNGKGMDKEALNHIFDKKENKKSGGVGVNNVNNRLKLYYGSRYGLRFRSQVDVGTMVEVRIPVSSEEDSHYEKY